MTEFQDWTRGVLFLGKHNSTYIPVLVDENGNLRILMQGEWEGELRTVALDEDGRLSAFVIDSSDAWEQILAIGNAELAARLGSCVKYDRSGSTWYLNDFRNGWSGGYSWGSGNGWSVSFTPSPAINGGYSLKLVGGSDNYRFAEANFETPVLFNKQYGFSILFSLEDNIVQVRLLVTFYDGSNSWSAYADLDVASQAIEIVDASSGSTVVANNVKVRTDSNMFNLFKMVMDFQNKKYTRILFNDLDVDCTGYTFPSSVSTENPFLHAVARFYSSPGNNGIAYLDSVRISIADS